LYAATINDLLRISSRTDRERPIGPVPIEKELRFLAKARLVSLNSVLEELGIMQLINLTEEQRVVGAPLYLLLPEEPLDQFFPDYKERESFFRSWKQRNRRAFNKAREKQMKPMYQKLAELDRHTYRRLYLRLNSLSLTEVFYRVIANITRSDALALPQYSQCVEELV